MEFFLVNIVENQLIENTQGIRKEIQDRSWNTNMQSIKRNCD